MPYRNNGAVESIDHKWFITRKQVQFDRGTINWELTRAREMPLARSFTTKNQFLQGFGERIDFEASPGSVVIALDGVPYFSDGIYNLIINVRQQPERDGSWTLTDTTPGDSTVVYQAWASEINEFSGEEVWLGIIEDGDPVTIKTRFYKISARLKADSGLAQTPSIDAISISFPDG